MSSRYVVKKENNIRAHESMTNNRSSRSLLFKTGVPKNLSKFTGKHRCRSFFSDKVSDWRLATLLKRVSGTCYFPVNFAF